MFTNLQVLSSFKGSGGYLRIYVFFQGQTLATNVRHFAKFILLIAIFRYASIGYVHWCYVIFCVKRKI